MASTSALKMSVARTAIASSKSLRPAAVVARAASSSAAAPAQDWTLPEIHLGQTHPSRYGDHYHNTVATDLMYMTYEHRPAASTSASTSSAPPVRSPETMTPYELNRPVPSPKGNRPLRPAPTPVTPTNIPSITSITIHTMVKEAIGNKQGLLSAIMALRAISGETANGGGRSGSSGVQVIQSRSGAAAFKLRAGMPVAAKVELKGDAMYDFLQSLVDFVLPRIREFPGIPVPPSSASKLSPSAVGGVVSFGFDASTMALFPQIEANLDSYPRMHGFHIQIATSAKGKGAQEKARTLLSGFRIPFAKR